MADVSPLRLSAFDAEDLAIISAHLQDAVLKVGDMTFQPGEQRFGFIANRFDWMDGQDRSTGPYRRARAGVTFERVEAVRTRNIRQANADAVLELLAIRFEPADAPSGVVLLEFAGGGSIRLETECIEVRLEDLGPVWETKSRPAHNPDGGESSDGPASGKG
ncbi:MAG: DUF2948 family protein [Hyphomicrobiales bacterium]